MYEIYGTMYEMVCCLFEVILPLSADERRCTISGGHGGHLLALYSRLRKPFRK